MDLISIIVPVYNVERYLERCVNSLLGQSYKNIEIILVDDGSSDRSSEICDSFSIENEQIQVIHKANGGLGFARNSGLDIAKGKYVTFVDGDDYIEPMHLENMVQLLRDTGSDTCIAGHTRVYKDKSIVKGYKLAGQVFENREIVKEVLVRMCGKQQDLSDYIEMSVCMVLLSNELIQKHKLRFKSEREFISEDLIFDTEYYPLAQRVCISGDTGYCYCDNDGSLTTKYRANRFELQKTMFCEMKKRMRYLDAYDLSSQRLMTTFVSITRYCIKLEVKYAKQNSNRIAWTNINKICKDEVLTEVLREYNNNLVPLKSRIVNLLIKFKVTPLLVLIMHIKNKYNI